MHLTQFRKDNNMVKLAERLLEQPEMQAMLAMLRDSAPVTAPLPFGHQITPQDHSRQLGRIEGYHMALLNLQDAARPFEKARTIEADFQP